MPCDTRVNLTAESKRRMASALDRLEKAINLGQVKVVVGATGSIAFKGWDDREGWSDLCAFRRLRSKGSTALRMAIARAEALAGRQVDARAVASGLHSHDGGHTWNQGH